MKEALESFLGISLGKIGESLIQTVYMVSVSLIIATVFAFLFAVLLAFTRKGGIFQNLIVYNVLNVVINIVRSTPFIVLLVAVMPLTKALIGTRIGPTAAIVPMTLSSIPFMARLMENSLLDTGKGILEAAQSVGATPMQIIIYFILPESLGSLILSLTTGVVGLIGSSAMAGYVGGGGIGALIQNYGYNKFNFTLMYSLVVLLILVTQLIQSLGSKLAAIARKNK